MPSPTTPPTSQGASTGSHLSKQTPLKHDIQGSESHSSYPRQKASIRYQDMARDAADKFVGPMPMDQFLSEFVPKAPAERPANEITFSDSSVSEKEDAFIDAVEASGLCPEIKLVNTTHHPGSGQPDLLKPDISIYWGDLPTDTRSRLEWKKVDLWVENKNNGDDIFCGLAKMKQSDEEFGSVRSHVKWTPHSRRICGQLTAYAAQLHRSQFRVFSFAVVLFGETGRLLRWDRSGVIYTEPFDWKREPETLFEFFWRLNFLSEADRGHDTTVTSAKEDEANAALSVLKTYKGLENIKFSELHKFHVRDDRDIDGELRSYIAPSAVWNTHSLFGRSTFGYIAYDVTGRKLVYLKDFWRTDLPDIQKEGDVYRELHAAQVPNIPVLGLAGDVPLSLVDTTTAPFAVQRTRTQDYVRGSRLGYEWCPGRPRVEPYVHYRVVLETLGEPLNTFKSTRQLCEVIRDAIVAHTAAYEKAQILHRDVSAGNILIADDGSGLLIDWDLSKKVIPDVDTKPRRHSRTGTWQFISIARLRDHTSWPHEVSDDLESFFWVLLYQVAKCRAAGLNLDEEMQNVFDFHTKLDEHGIVRGGKGKLNTLRNGELDSSTIDALVNTPCRDIIRELTSLFHDFYLHLSARMDLGSLFLSKYEAKRQADPRFLHAHKRLRSSEWVLDMINGHLASEWEVNDDGSLHQTALRPDSKGSANCKKRQASDCKDDKLDSFGMQDGRMPPGFSVSSNDGLSDQGCPYSCKRIYLDPSSHDALDSSDRVSVE